MILAAHGLEIPFAVTEYAEQSAETQVYKQFPVIVASAGMQPREDYTIEMNPFQRPGQRPLPNIRLPNLCNGFTITVVKAKKSAAAAPAADDLAARVGSLDLDLD